MKNRIIISLFLLAAFCAAPVFAQENSNLKNECKSYIEDGFSGTWISLEFYETDIRYFLQFFNEKFRCEFKLDESVGFIPITVEIKNVPWTSALENVLKSHNLDLMTKTEFDETENTEKVFFFVADEDKILREKEKINPIYTEIFGLKNLPVCGSIAECEQFSDAINRIKKFASRRLSRRGLIEYDEKNQTLIVSDERLYLDEIIRYCKNS